MAAAMVLASVGLSSVPAHAAVLVSNMAQASPNLANLRVADYAQAFTTGSNASGYTLTSVEISIFDLRTSTNFSVSIHASEPHPNPGLPRRPSTRLATLTAPGTLTTGANAFTHTGLDLSANTTYMVVVDSSAANTPDLDVTNLPNEDSGGAAGWSIENNNWNRARATTNPWGNQASRALLIRINGTVKAAPPPSPSATISVGTSPVTEGTDASFTVTLSSAAPSGGLTVNLTVSESAGSDYVASGDEGAKTLAFAQGETTKTYTVATVADGNDEPNGSVTVTLSSGTGYMLGATTSASVTVNDDDSPTGPVGQAGLAISPSSLRVTEGGTGRYTVALRTQPGADVTVAITGAATYASLSTSSLTFTTSNWNQPQTVTVTAADDDRDEEYAPVTLRHAASSSDSDYAGLTQNVQVTVADSETRGVVVSVEELRVSEGSDGSYTVVLASEPTEAVEITVSSSNTEVIVSPTSLTFTASDWREAQTVTVTGAANEMAELTHQVSSPGDYASVTAPSVQVNAHFSTLGEINEELLPRVTQAMMSSTLSALSGRLAGQAGEGAMSLERELASVVMAAGGPGSLDARRLLGGKGFMLPLNAAANQTGGTIALWGRADYRDLDGGDDRAICWDGDVASLHVGLDREMRPGLLAGLMVSWQDGRFDYRERDSNTEGSYDSELASVHPYVSWRSPEDDLRAWATVGYGRGEVEINAGEGKHSSDTRLKAGAAGGSARLASVRDRFLPGVTTLRLEAEGLVAEIKTDGGAGIDPSTSDFERVRIGLQAQHVLERGPGEQLSPWVEVGTRHDSGDGLTGTGMEISTGVRYANAAKGLTVQGEARVLVNHSDDYDEWGVHGEIHVDPGADGLGLGFRLSPGWGLPGGSEPVSREFQQNPGMLPESGSRQAQGRLDAEVEYGLPALQGRGLMTPYARVALAGGSGDFRVGSRLRVKTDFSLDVSGGRFGQADGSSGLGLEAFAELRF